jgi:hypothetical protein
MRVSTVVGGLANRRGGAYQCGGVCAGMQGGQKPWVVALWDSFSWVGCWMRDMRGTWSCVQIWREIRGTRYFVHDGNCHNSNWPTVKLSTPYPSLLLDLFDMP